MQITFHGKSNATKAHVACTFTPAPGADDNITQMIGKKAATITSINNNGRSLSFNEILITMLPAARRQTTINEVSSS